MILCPSRSTYKNNAVGAHLAVFCICAFCFPPKYLPDALRLSSQPIAHHNNYHPSARVVVYIMYIVAAIK